MSIYTVHGGHAAQGQKYSGAAGFCYESVENRAIKDALIKYLRNAGHTVYDCTVDSGSSQSDIISQIKKKINAHAGATANISIHLDCFDNAAKGTSCQVYSKTGETGVMAQRICNRLSSLGFQNRGVVERTDLGVLKGITNGGVNILIETFFCDNLEDTNRYKLVGGADAFGKEIASAILNANLTSNIERKDENMAEVQLYTPNGSDAQLWKPHQNSDGSWSLESVSCGKYLEVAGGSSKNGSKVQVYKLNGSAAQRWILKEKAGVYNPTFVRPVLLIPGTNGNARLDCVSGGKKDGTPIDIYDQNGTAAQDWQIIDHGNGTWTLINVGSCKALDVVGGGV